MASGRPWYSQKSIGPRTSSQGPATGASDWSTRVNHDTIVYQYRPCTTTDWSTRVNHNTIVYKYRACTSTQCRCILPAHYAHSVIQCRPITRAPGCGAPPAARRTPRCNGRSKLRKKPGSKLKAPPYSFSHQSFVLKPGGGAFKPASSLYHPHLLLLLPTAAQPCAAVVRPVVRPAVRSVVRSVAALGGGGRSFELDLHAVGGARAGRHLKTPVVGLEKGEKKFAFQEKVFFKKHERFQHTRGQPDVNLMST